MFKTRLDYVRDDLTSYVQTLLDEGVWGQDARGIAIAALGVIEDSLVQSTLSDSDDALPRIMAILDEVVGEVDEVVLTPTEGDPVRSALLTLAQALGVTLS